MAKDLQRVLREGAAIPNEVLGKHTYVYESGADTTSASEKLQRIPTLDGWRGIAILLVLVDHSAQYGRFKNWTNIGSFGVDIFFVLSGYIITARLIRERALHGRIDLRAFYFRRAFRILPLVIIYLSTLCLISRVINLADFHWRELVGALFFFRNYQYAADTRGVFTSHFWSLSIEEHFYLLWPGLFLLLRARWALWLAALAALASSLWRLYESYHPTIHLIRVAAPRLTAIQTGARLDGLFLGAALAVLLSSARVHSFILKNFQRETPVILLPAVAVTLLFASGRPSFILYLLVAVAISYTLIVKEGVMFWCLNRYPLVWIGEISYSLYVWQQLFLSRPVATAPLGHLSIFPFNLACAFLAATFSFYFLEKPAIALGKRYFARGVKALPAKGIVMIPTDGQDLALESVEE